MKTNPELSRRQFLKNSAAAAAALALPATLSAAGPGEASPWKVCAFEKPLQMLTYDEVADVMAELGFDGIEATVRPGGHVLPERVEEDLPKFVEALKKRKLEITILTSGINNATHQHTEKVLRTAARLGIQRYRMMWWRYDLKKPIWPQVEALRPVLRDLVALNREAGITGLYQNHAGADMVGASLWDIFELIKDYPVKDIGLAYDIRHAQVEGGLSWPTQFYLVKSHIGAVCVKDFEWHNTEVKNVPLGKGRVTKKIMTLVKEAKFSGPISVHVEYADAGGKQAIIEAFREDYQTLRSWLK